MAAKTIRSNQTRGLRLVKAAPIQVDNFQDTVDIPRGPAVEFVELRISGTFAITVAFTTVRNIAAYRFLKRADFVLNSNVTLDSVSGPQLAQLYVTRRTYPPVTNPAGVAIAGGYSFDAVFIFDRAIMDMMRPKDSMLKTDVGVANLQLRLQFGALSDLFTGAGTATYTAVTYSVSVGDYQEQKAADGSTPSPSFYAKRNGFTVPIAGASNGNLVKLNTGNRVRIVSLRVLDGVTFEPNIALVTRFGIKRAGDQRVDIPAAELNRLNVATYGAGAGALLAGQLLYDFANVGQLVGCRYSEFWPIPSSADTFAVIDTTGATLLEFATLEGVDL